MSNPFAFPYLGRIMGRLPGHEPIELFRPERGQYVPNHEITTRRRQMDPAWIIYVEKTTYPHALISDRPMGLKPQFRTSTKGLQIPHEQILRIETGEQSVAIQSTPINEL